MADGLTKPWQGDQLIQALERKEWAIVFDPSFMSAKKRKQLAQLRKKCADPEWAHCVFMLDEACHGQKSFWSCDELEFNWP